MLEPQESCWTGVPVSTTQGEQNYIKANTKYVAVGLQGGGGPLAVMNLDKPCRYDREMPVIQGHTAAVLDFDFNPFHEQIIASGSDDCTIKVRLDKPAREAAPARLFVSQFCFF